MHECNSKANPDNKIKNKNKNNNNNNNFGHGRLK